jgi:uncharacterized protein DUF4350
VKERLATAVLAAAALFLFYGLMLPKPQPPGQERSQPQSIDKGPDGQWALWRWFETQHVPVVSLRRRYDDLAGSTGSVGSTGNVLITVLPHRVPMRAGEADAIRHWVAAGNTLLVIAALDDTPTWTLGIEQTLLQETEELTGMKFSVIPKKPPAEGPRTLPLSPSARTISDRQPADQPPPADRGAQRGQDLTGELKDLVKHPEIELEPVGSHPLTADVHTVHAHLSLPSSRWRAGTSDAAILTLLQRRDSGAAAMWLLRSGEGQVIVSSVASPWANDEIGREDNARLLSNILRWSRAPAGRVYFDDAHQGLTDYYDAQAFFADPRLHRTIGWLLLGWLAFVLGPLPLRSTYSLWKPLDEMALVDASGRFYSVAVEPIEAAQRLFDNFFNRLRAHLRLPQNGAPLWEWLQVQGTVAPHERKQLQSLYRRVQMGRRVRLAPLQTLLSDMEGKLV